MAERKPNHPIQADAHPGTFFPPHQVVHGDGCYPNGRVHVEVLPPEVHGEGCCRDFSLRRIEGVLGEKELKEHVGKELLKVRARALLCCAVRFAVLCCAVLYCALC